MSANSKAQVAAASTGEAFISFETILAQGEEHADDLVALLEDLPKD